MGEAAWIQLAVYVVTLVWGAATVKAELKYLRMDLNETKDALAKASTLMMETLSDHGERISKIEGRLQ